jgi:hypothetical protein
MVMVMVDEQFTGRGKSEIDYSVWFLIFDLLQAREVMERN